MNVWWLLDGLAGGDIDQSTYHREWDAGIGVSESSDEEIQFEFIELMTGAPCVDA